jgi:hypothetical protein
MELRTAERALQAAVLAVARSEERASKARGGSHDDAGQLLALASIKLQAMGNAPDVGAVPSRMIWRSYWSRFGAGSPR